MNENVTFYIKPHHNKERKLIFQVAIGNIFLNEKKSKISTFRCLLSELKKFLLWLGFNNSEINYLLDKCYTKGLCVLNSDQINEILTRSKSERCEKKWIALILKGDSIQCIKDYIVKEGKVTLNYSPTKAKTFNTVIKNELQFALNFEHKNGFLHFIEINS